jgi:microcystin-dependent protein
MSDQFLGEIRVFPFNFAPLGWALCNGQILSISQNTALFSLLGTNYGGDGRSTFGLPNLQGRVPVDQGQGPGLSTYVVGQSGGASTVQLSAPQSAAHSHALVATSVIATSASPAGAIYAKGHYTATAGNGPVQAYTAQAPSSPMNTAALTGAGGGAAHNNLMPYLTLNFCIALSGIFPPRS